jgi:pimeloyl-ACP methyl ester carboxylesterase
MAANAPATIVFVHGTGDSARAWDGVIAALPEQRCLALDLPGHGAAAGATLPARAGVEGYADYVRTALARQGQAAVCLVGHSLGSAIALRLAVEAPALVTRLVLVGAGARLRVLPALLALAATSPDDAMRRVVELGFAPAHRVEADRYAAALALASPGTVLRDLAVCDAFDMMGELGRVAQPALVVVGEEDRLTPPKYAAYLRDQLAHAQLVMIPGAGHYLNAEAPAQVASAIRDWLG